MRPRRRRTKAWIGLAGRFFAGEPHEHFQKASGSWGKAHPMIHTVISTAYQMSKRRFTSITRGIHDFGEPITYGTWKLGVGHETASNLSVHFSISHMGISAATFKAAEIHGEEKCFRYGNPLFVKCMITMCKY